MALYEDLRHNRRPRAVTIPYASTHPMRTSAPALSMAEVKAMVRVVLLAFLLLCWMAAAYAGIIYWSLQGSLFGVLASAVVPGFAATCTWWAFAALKRPRARPQ